MIKKQYQNVSEAEPQNDTKNREGFEEEPSLRFDFEILHNTYFVFKDGIDIYYFNMLSYDHKSQKM